MAFKRNIVVIISLSLIGSNFNCDRNIELFYESDPIPIVYCLLNPSDSFCYVSITKSYQDTKNHFYSNPQECNVIDNVNIVLEAWGNGYKIWETVFEPLNQDAGDNSPFKRPIYKSLKPLNFTNSQGYFLQVYNDIDKFRLIITTDLSDKIVYSSIPVFPNPKIKSSILNKVITLYGDNKLKILFSEYDYKSKYYELICDLHYQEFHDNWINKTKSFIVNKDIQVFDSLILINFYEDIFFNKIVKAVKDSINPPRKFSSLDFTFIVADQFFDEYLATYENFSSNDNTNFGNIINGLGLFSLHRSVTLEGLKFDIVTIDSLCNGRITSSLNFIGW